MYTVRINLLSEIESYVFSFMVWSIEEGLLFVNQKDVFLLMHRWWGDDITDMVAARSRSGKGESPHGTEP